MNILGELNDKNILLLQGPVGYFFKKLDHQFRKKGANTFRIGLNAGDEFFSFKDNYIGYKDIPENWETFIIQYLKKNKIDKVFLFGDCRFYQKIMVKVSLKLSVEVFVFEEGYIRPNYITLERHGVNDYSRIPRKRDFYYNLDDVELPNPSNPRSNPIYIWAIVTWYYFIAKVFYFKYKHYRHHRNFSAIQEFSFGVRSLVRKMFYTYVDKKYLALIVGKYSKKYFFVPLQTHNDFQVLQHSNYGSIENFIIEVLESFRHNAPNNVLLMFKHHPIDRGRKNYKKFIFEKAKSLGIKNRIIVVHDLHLPTCLKNAIGTVTINSTVGLSSLYHGIPTITLGKAIYDIEGLTNKGKTLNSFWNSPMTPDKKFFQKFRQYLILNTQLNGSFYGCMPQI